MNLGIQGRRALICGASRGLGRGCAEALAKEGVHVALVARTAATLEKTAEELRHIAGGDVNIKTVACDITTPGGRRQAKTFCSMAGLIPAPFERVPK